MRRNVILIAAFAVLALAGAAGAATHYLVTSTAQLTPHVRAQLTGRRGRRGHAGVKGVNGSRGLPSPGPPVAPS
jgi:hypothetical protein